MFCSGRTISPAVLFIMTVIGAADIWGSVLGCMGRMSLHASTGGPLGRASQLVTISTSKTSDLRKTDMLDFQELHVKWVGLLFTRVHITRPAPVRRGGRGHSGNHNNVVV